MITSARKREKHILVKDNEHEKKISGKKSAVTFGCPNFLWKEKKRKERSL